MSNALLKEMSADGILLGILSSDVFPPIFFEVLFDV